MRLLGAKSITLRDRCVAKCGWETLPETTGQRRRRQAKERRMADAAEWRQRMGTPPENPYWTR